jgi:tetratricopeptide (TPR) repeat protein
VRRLLRGPAVHPSAVRVRSRRGDLAPELSAAYDALLDRTEEFARRTARLPRHEVKRFRRALALLQSGRGVDALAKDGDMLVKGLGVYEAVLARSWAVRFDNPCEMCHLARVAVEVAEHLDAEVLGESAVKDYQARAWGELANAYRVADRLQEAGQAFGTAFELARQGTRDPRLRMRLLDLEASLLGTQREFALALPRLTSLAELHHEAGDPHREGRALIKQAAYTFYSGRPRKALELNSEALGLIDEEREPSLAAVAAQNQLLFLVECGRFREARTILFKNRARFTNPGQVLWLKVRWLEGRIDHGLRQLDRAEAIFREVKKGFEEAGMGFACALAGLDLALTLMCQGRWDEAVAETLQAAAMFEALSVHREALGVVVFLEQEFQRRRGNRALLENTVWFLRRKLIERGWE